MVNNTADKHGAYQAQYTQNQWGKTLLNTASIDYHTLANRGKVVFIWLNNPAEIHHPTILKPQNYSNFLPGKDISNSS